MLAWLSQNWGNIVILTALALLLLLVVYFRVRAHREGRSCNGCAGCAMKDVCRDKYKKKP